MKPSPRQEIPQCTSTRLTSPTVLKNGQVESTGSDGRSTGSKQLDLFWSELKFYKEKMRNAQVL